jgi:hypothetical protein
MDQDTSYNEPNYRYWDTKSTYNLLQAAWLFCGYTPPNSLPPPSKTPSEVQDVTIRLLEEVPHENRAEARRITHGGPATPQVVHDNLHIPWMDSGIRENKLFFKREDLRRWAEDNKLEDVAIFLFPERRQKPAPDKWGFQHDTRLLGVAREVVKDYWEGKPPEKALKKEALVDEICGRFDLTKNEAQAIDLVTRHDRRRQGRPKYRG